MSYEEPVTLEKKERGVRLKVRVGGLNNAVRAKLIMRSLWDRVEDMLEGDEKRIWSEDQDPLVREALEKTRRFRMIVDGEPRIIGIDIDAYAIALSILESFPNPKRPINITNEIQIHSGRVSRVLTGSRGDFAKYFRKSAKGYSLNKEGLDWFFNTILPALETIELPGESYSGGSEEY
jgi:hypothetical protein